MNCWKFLKAWQCTWLHCRTFRTCVFRQAELQFLGHIMDASGVKAEPSKVSAISDLNAPTNVHEFTRVSGMINNYIGISTRSSVFFFFV